MGTSKESFEMSRMQRFYLRKSSPKLKEASLLMGRCLLGLLVAIKISVADPMSSAEEESVFLDRVETYLNELTTLKASFKQMNPDGSLHEGLFFLSRPGKMRLKYQQPLHQVIIADGHFLIFYNPDLEEVTRVPLDATPAELLVKEKVTLRKDAQILKVWSEENRSFLTVARQDDPDAGTLTLVFSHTPFRLKEWIIRDQNDALTHVLLEEIERNTPLPPALFTFEASF